MDGKRENSIHQGHRRRMLETYLSAGEAGFSDVELLEFLLSYAIPRKDTNPIAHRLLQEYGSLHRIAESPVEQLTEVEGVSTRAAVLIRFLEDFYRRCRRSRACDEGLFQSTNACGEYLLTRFGSLREEHAYLMSLDGRCSLLDCRELCSGSVNSVNLPYRKVAETALRVNATSVILAHNHTGSSVLPSREDILYTDGLREALELVGVTLADHFVICGDEYFSMRSAGIFRLD